MRTIRPLAAAVSLALASTAAVSAQPGLAQRLVGTWYWEKTTYVSAGDYSMLIKASGTLTLRGDGTFRYVEAGTHTGVRVYEGQYAVSGDMILARDSQGRTLNLRYQILGSNGLILGGHTVREKVMERLTAR